MFHSALWLLAKQAGSRLGFVKDFRLALADRLLPIAEPCHFPLFDLIAPIVTPHRPTAQTQSLSRPDIRAVGSPSWSHEASHHGRDANARSPTRQASNELSLLRDHSQMPDSGRHL